RRSRLRRRRLLRQPRPRKHEESKGEFKMTLGMLAIVAAVFLALNAMFTFNDRFRSRFFGTAWKLKMFVIVPVILYLLVKATLGSEFVGHMAPQLMLLLFTIIQVVFFSVFQIFIM